MRSPAIVALSILLPACSNTWAWPFNGLTELASADGATFFATAQIDSVQLGTTDGHVAHIEHEMRTDGIAVRTLCAATRDVAWVVVDDRLLRRDPTGWTEVEIPGDDSFGLLGVACLGADHVLVPAYQPDATELGYTFRMLDVQGDVVRVDPLSYRVGPDFTTSAAGELLADGYPPRVLRDGEWLEGPFAPTLWTQLATGGHIVQFDGSGGIRAWAGDEIEDLSISIEHPESTAGAPSIASSPEVEVLRSVLMIGEVAWAAIVEKRADCSVWFGYYSCGWVTTGYRVVRRVPGGEWEPASELRDGEFPSLVDIGGHPCVVVPGWPDMLVTAL